MGTVRKYVALDFERDDPIPYVPKAFESATLQGGEWSELGRQYGRHQEDRAASSFSETLPWPAVENKVSVYWQFDTVPVTTFYCE